MADLIQIDFESSFSPRTTIGTSDILGGDRAAVPGTGEGEGPPPALPLSRVLSNLILRIARPKARVQGPLGLDKTIAPYGEPYPWWIALPALMLAVGAASAGLYALALRWYKRAARG